VRAGHLHWPVAKTRGLDILDLSDHGCGARVGWRDLPSRVSCIPFCGDSRQAVTHKCPSCKMTLGRYKGGL
jgi:hypothetical protein